MLVEIVEEGNYTNFLGYERAVLVVSLEDCIHCKEYKPVIELVAGRLPDVRFGVAVLKRGTRYLTKLKTDFKLEGVPTTLFLKRGLEVHRIEYAEMNDEKIYAMIKEKLMDM